jgi:hypothetical protein
VQAYGWAVRVRIPPKNNLAFSEKETWYTAIRFA